jgi:four helix bundle protein
MAANYRAVGRARSKAEFVAKLGIVLEEVDETVFWLELLTDAGIPKDCKSMTAKACIHGKPPITRSPDHPMAGSA